MQGDIDPRIVWMSGTLAELRRHGREWAARPMFMAIAATLGIFGLFILIALLAGR